MIKIIYIITLIINGLGALSHNNRNRLLNIICFVLMAIMLFVIDWDSFD